MKDWIKNFPKDGSRKDKLNYLHKNHPDSLKHKGCGGNKEKATVLLVEAFQKGYTFIPAEEPKQSKTGYVVYKELEINNETFELSYNSVWNIEEEGEYTGIEEIDKIKITTKEECGDDYPSQPFMKVLK